LRRPWRRGDWRARLGHSGLDPADVFENLPEVMMKCLERQDIGMLQQIFKELPKEAARYHMKRCVDSRLWCSAKDDPATAVCAPRATR